MSGIGAGLITRVRHTRFIRNIPVKANAVFRPNDLVLYDPANTRAFPGQTGTGFKCLGICVQGVDATGLADGAVTVDAEQGDFLLGNSATNTCTQADVDKIGTAYAEDTNIVGNSSAGNSAVGPIIGLGWQNLPGVIVRIES